MTELKKNKPKNDELVLTWEIGPCENCQSSITRTLMDNDGNRYCARCKNKKPKVCYNKGG